MTAPKKAAAPKGTPRRRTSTLVPHLDQIVQWKLAGISDRGIADQLGVDNTTVSRFVARPEIVKAIDQAHREMIRVAVRRTAAAAGPALNILLTAINPETPNVPWPTRILAANSIFKLLGTERLAESMDDVGDAIAGSVRSSLNEKIARMEAIDVTPLLDEDDEADEFDVLDAADAADEDDPPLSLVR